MMVPAATMALRAFTFRARAALDRFRESVLPANNYRITLYEAGEDEITGWMEGRRSQEEP